MNAADVLARVQVTLTPETWCGAGRTVTIDGRASLVVHCWVAADYSDATAQEAVLQLGRTLGSTADAMGAVIAFNDDPSTTFADVRDLVERALLLAREDAA